MMNLRDLLAEAFRRRVTFSVNGTQLRYSGPGDEDFDDLLDRFKPFHRELHGLLTALETLLRRGGAYYSWTDEDRNNCRLWARRDIDAAIEYLRREASKIPRKEVRRRQRA